MYYAITSCESLDGSSGWGYEVEGEGASTPEEARQQATVKDGELDVPGSQHRFRVAVVGASSPEEAIEKFTNKSP